MRYYAVLQVTLWQVLEAEAVELEAYHLNMMQIMEVLVMTVCHWLSH